jgi:hypothetical protein
LTWSISEKLLWLWHPSFTQSLKYTFEIILLWSHKVIHLRPPPPLSHSLLSVFQIYVDEWRWWKNLNTSRFSYWIRKSRDFLFIDFLLPFSIVLWKFKAEVENLILANTEPNSPQFPLPLVRFFSLARSPPSLSHDEKE